MALQITARRLEVGADEKQYIEKKIKRFERMFDKIDEMCFTMTAEKTGCTVEASFRAGTVRARVKDKDSDPRGAIDKAVDRLEIQVSKAKERRTDRHRKKLGAKTRKAAP